MSVTFLQSLKNIRSSKGLDGLKELWANQMGYRKMGLVYDDLIPEENALVQEALRRLPPREFQDRTFRFRTAFALDVTQTELPKEYHVTAETDKPYLRPILAQVEREIATKQYFDNMTEIPAALAKRNRSS